MIYKKLINAQFFVIILVVLVNLILGELQLSLKCGDKLCLHEVQYCNPFSNSCDNCSKICDEGRNFDEPLCVKHCQDFLYDKRYSNRNAEHRRTLEETVNRLEIEADISLIISSLALLLIVLYIAIQLIRWIRRGGLSSKCLRSHFTNKKKPSNNNTENVVSAKKTSGGTKLSELRIEMPSSPSSDTTHAATDTPQTVCTSISRRGAPAEDRAVDYAYDNRAMTPPSAANTNNSSF